MIDDGRGWGPEWGEQITRRVQSEWRNWNRVSGVLYDRTFSTRDKGKVNENVVRPAMMYSA